MTREEGIEKLKEVRDVPVPIGAAAVPVGSLSEADLGAVVGLDIDSLINTLEKILPWIAVFVPQLAPFIPFIPKLRDVIKLIQELIALFGPQVTAGMIADAA